MGVSHKNDTSLDDYLDFELFDNDKSGCVWYGDQAVAFVATDNQVHFLLPTELLEEFPYYSLSYGGLAAVYSLGNEELFLLIKHWRHKIFGGPISDEELARAKALEAQILKPGLSAIGDTEKIREESRFEIDSMSYICRSNQGLKVCIRQDVVEAKRVFDTHERRRFMGIKKMSSFSCKEGLSFGGLRWYLEDTRQKEFLIYRAFSTNICMNSKYVLEFSDKTLIRGNSENRINKPRFLCRVENRERRAEIFQLADMNGIKKTWVLPTNTVSVMPAEAWSNAANIAGIDDVRKGWDTDDGGFKDPIEFLDDACISCCDNVTVDQIAGLVMVAAALESSRTGDKGDQMIRVVNPVFDVLLNDMDLREAIIKMQDECPGMDKRWRDPDAINQFNSTTFNQDRASAARYAVEFTADGCYGYPLRSAMRSYWRKGARLAHYDIRKEF